MLACVDFDVLYVCAARAPLKGADTLLVCVLLIINFIGATRSLVENDGKKHSSKSC